MNRSTRTNLNLLGLAIAAALLSACDGGGGGGNAVRPDPPPPPPPQVCNDPNATNRGGPLPCTYRYNGEVDNLLVPVNADLAHAEGFTGNGVKVGVVDVFNIGSSAIHGYSALEGKVDFLVGPVDSEVDSDNYHGIAVSAVLLGNVTGSFKGGVAPGARLYANHGGGVDVLSEQGVRLFNRSLGMDGLGGIGFFDFYGKKLIETDALLVNGAGNEGREVLPMGFSTFTDYPELYGHMIAATAVFVDAQGNPIVADYANKCGGPAMSICVAAPSLQQIPVTPGFDFEKEPGARVPGDDTLMRVNGTSISTPIVTGVAALVWEAYPWMSAPNIQQTVLTTATDIGEPGVDPIYGWGLVNARKAIDGPAQFISNQYIGGFTANFEGASRPFYNDISGEGWLWKLGSGTLTLTGNNTYTGGTTVEQGTLRSSGSFGSDVEIAPGARFETAGTGVTINGDFDVYNAEEWNFDLPVNEHRFGAATVAIQLGAPLTVTGRAVIDDGSRLTLLPEAQNYTVKATETLITANQGLVGRFSELTYGNGFFWTASLNYGPNALTANMTRAQAQAKAMSIGAPQQVVDGAKAADALIGHLDRLVENGQAGGNGALLSAAARLMAAPSDDHAALSLSSLTGDIHGAARALGVQRSLGEGERLADRLRGLNEPGMWVNSGNGNGTLSRVGYGDAEVHHSAFGFGTDTKVGDTWTVGLAATQTRSNAHLDTLGGRLTGQGQQMALYGRRDIGANGYLTGLVSHDRHTVDTQRRVLTGTALNSVVGQHEDAALLARLETGIRLKGGLTPYLAAGSLSLRQGGFTESGTLGLSASADTFTARFVDVGSRFDRQVGNWTFGSTLSARRMFGGDSGFNATFTGAEVASFTVNGQPLARTSVRFGGDVSYRTRNGWNLALGLGADQGQGQRTNAWGEATVRFGF